jgi:hypothetical protein
MGHSVRVATAHRVDLPRRRGLALAGLTIAWNVIEAVVAITAGIAAGSIALVGFGFDSTVEVMSSVVVVWQFRGEVRSGYDEDHERNRQDLWIGFVR